jgi:hypothetical protein
LSVPVYDFAIEHEELANVATDGYYSCCGKNICKGCAHSFEQSGNDDKCPFCNSDRADKTEEDRYEELMKRVEANDAFSMCVMGSYYYHGGHGLLQNREKAKELWTQAAKLGSSRSHYHLGTYYHAGGDSKKEKFHHEAAAMAGHEVARYLLGCVEVVSRNMERAVKHLTIAASAGHYDAMNFLIEFFKKGHISRESIDSTLIAYNNSCVEMRSEARDAAIHADISLSNNEQL